MNKGIFRKITAAGLALMMLIALAPSMGLANSPIYFTVTYKPNSPINQDPSIDSTMGFYTVKNNPFSSPPGYAFNGWDTQADGSGTRYAPGKAITVTEPLTLYAQWKIAAVEIVSITYIDNIAGSRQAPVTDYANKGDAYKLKDNPFVYPPTHTFIGWNTKANGSGKSYKPGKVLIVNSNHTLYAQWKIMDTVTITYKANLNIGGNQEDVTDVVIKNSAYTLRDNLFSHPRVYSFMGWNTKADGSGSAYKPGKVLTANGSYTLYAQWELMENTISITYKANANDSQTDVIDFYIKDSTVQIKANPFTNPDPAAKFLCWIDGSGAHYNPGMTITANAFLTLYAQWMYTPPETVTITYKAYAYDSELDVKETVTKGSSYTIQPYKFMVVAIYTFLGWSTQPINTGIYYQPGQVITANAPLTLYAQFRLVSSQPPY